ncbi:regulatory protein RecX [Kribbella sp. C-35]|uniref:regulatory protein RecX n=1 Tax=Kribbella sp. C-35 TaxID=2789276 RepID=UPI00397DC96C
MSTSGSEPVSADNTPPASAGAGGSAGDGVRLDAVDSASAGEDSWPGGAGSASARVGSAGTGAGSGSAGVGAARGGAGSGSGGAGSAGGGSGSGRGGAGRGSARRRVGGGFGRRGKRPVGDEPQGTGDPGFDGADADPYSVARTILLDKLTGQPRTRAELADLLAERDIPDEVADAVLDRFTDVGLIDDAAFANAWVESRHRGRGLGKRALAQELRRRGVDDQLARDALEELQPEQEEEKARELVRRKLRSMRSLERQVAMRRLLGMLARKGYPGGMAMSIVKQELDASHDEFPLVDESGLGPE